jgi:predicted thioesterase
MLNVGDTAEVSITVQSSDTAEALSISAEDVFPAVLATSRMIALMEIAAARAMKSEVQPDHLSVGVSLNVKHTAATPVGCHARAVATFIGVEGKLFRFRVEAFDDAGLIGEGDHTRAIVFTDRMLAGAERRKR